MTGTMRAWCWVIQDFRIGIFFRVFSGWDFDSVLCRSKSSNQWSTDQHNNNLYPSIDVILHVIDAPSSPKCPLRISLSYVWKPIAIKILQLKYNTFEVKYLSTNLLFYCFAFWSFSKALISRDKIDWTDVAKFCGCHLLANLPSLGLQPAISGKRTPRSNLQAELTYCSYIKI